MSWLFLLVPVASFTTEVDSGAGVRRHSDTQLADAAEAVRREHEAMLATPVWKTWLGTAAPDAGWRQLNADASLVGIKWKGLGSYPEGMSGTEPKSQVLEFNFECKDASGNFSFNSAKVTMQTHKSDFGRGSTQSVKHMEGNGLEVFYEKEGDYARASHNMRYLMAGKVTNCKNLELDIGQRVFMDKALIAEQKEKKLRALSDAGYSSEEMQVAYQAYGKNLMGGGLPMGDPMVSVEAHIAEHDRQVREMVESQVLKRAEDYGLVQDVYAAQNMREGDETGGYFKFGAGSMTNVQVSEGKSVLGFEFQQTCDQDPRIRKDVQLVGAKSPANCDAGKRGLVLLTGTKANTVMSMSDDGEFTALRLVLYLEQ